MGMDYTTVKWLLASDLQWQGKQVLTIGRQNWWLSKREAKSLGVAFCPKYSNQTYSESFWTNDLHVLSIESVDKVNGEKPTFIADLSVDYCLRYSGSWDVICEFGTAEHVANQFAFWRNIYSCLNQNGRVLVVVPCDSLAGHGLYQFSPEFFTNMGGFKVIRCHTVTYGPRITFRPFVLGGRHQTSFRWPTFVFAELQKTNKLFSLPVQKNTTVTHRQTPPLAQFLVELPGIRFLERLIRR